LKADLIDRLKIKFLLTINSVNTQQDLRYRYSYAPVRLQNIFKI